MALSVSCPKCGKGYIQGDINIGPVIGCPNCFLKEQEKKLEEKIQQRIMKERKCCAERARRVLMLNSESPHWPDIAYDAIMNPPNAYKYRKKPVVVEAVQFTQMMMDGLKCWPEGVEEVGNGNGITNTKPIIRTLEGVMGVSVDDWIIKGIKNEFYPCKPDIFEATYEKVEDGV